MDYYKVPINRILVVTDDIYLPFGVLRLKAQGSSGGHNGLENIKKHMNTNHYPRLRIGVGHPADSDMADYVLERFKPAEQKELPDILIRAISAIELWLTKGILIAMNQTNLS